jgi:hypothetical protein
LINIIWKHCWAFKQCEKYNVLFWTRRHKDAKSLNIILLCGFAALRRCVQKIFPFKFRTLIFPIIYYSITLHQYSIYTYQKQLSTHLNSLRNIFHHKITELQFPLQLFILNCLIKLLTFNVIFH